MPAVALPRPRLIAGCAFLLIAIAYGTHLATPALFDEPNDAQYAEVAREMVVSGDWLSPQLNFVLFLNKPPLLYWLIAAAYTQLGISELAARLPGLLAMLVTLVLLYRLGEELFDGTTGLVAAALFAGMPAMLWEARSVRPDLLITATTIAAILAVVIAVRADGARQVRATYALQIALALGLLAKGMIALLLPAVPIVVIIVTERRWDLLRALLHPRSWWLFAVLIVPWHAIAAWRHTGFFWDYVVNQHLLFFLDRKEPRDSSPISLPLFWVAVLLRLFPWTLTVPLALVFTMRRWIDEPARRTALLVPCAWAAGTLGFFSVTVSRLEHYALPALPAVALLIAVALREAPAASAYWRAAVRAHYVATALVLAMGIFLLSSFLAGDPWLSGAPDIVSIPGPFLGTFILAFLISAFLVGRAPVAAVLVVAAAGLATTPMVRTGFNAFAPINSSAPIAGVITQVAAPETRIVFEAPLEYQLVAGLNFYLRQPVTLLRPVGFVEPTYLRPYRDLLFIDRNQLRELWSHADVIFVSDPLADPDRPIANAVPAPFTVIARIGNRWIVRNR